MGRKMKEPETERHCAHCQTLLVRNRYPNSMEDFGHFMRRTHCNNWCAGQSQAKDTLASRRKKASKHRKDQCQECGSVQQLQQHHLDLNTANNEPSNLMTLCASCHATWHWNNGKQMPSKRSVCVICGQPEHGLGYCQKHGQRFRKYGDPYLTKIRDGSRYVLVRETSSTESGQACRG